MFLSILVIILITCIYLLNKSGLREELVNYVCACIIIMFIMFGNTARYEEHETLREITSNEMHWLDTYTMLITALPYKVTKEKKRIGDKIQTTFVIVVTRDLEE